VEEHRDKRTLQAATCILGKYKIWNNDGGKKVYLRFAGYIFDFRTGVWY